MNHDTIIQEQLRLPFAEEHCQGSSPRVLLAEADAEMRGMLSCALSKYGYTVIECTNGFDLLHHLGARSFPLMPDTVDLVISDIFMPGISGLEILEGIHDVEGFPPFIMIANRVDRFTRQRARRHGAVSVFVRPFDVGDLLALVMETVPPASHSQRKAAMRP